MYGEDDIVVVFSTIDEESRAADLCRALVESNIAACANIVPRIRSIYRWKGDLCDDVESLMVIKTRKSLLGPLKDKIVALHPYEVPEIVALEVKDVHEPYLEWLLEQTK